MDLRDDLYWMALTVAQEAQAEPYEGQLAVALVIRNRAVESEGSISDTVLRRLQFSCWNSDSPTRMAIDTLTPKVFETAYKASCAAYFDLVPDFTLGANHYLNEPLTRQISGGNLPSWFDENKVTVRIGKHTFLRL